MEPRELTLKDYVAIVQRRLSWVIAVFVLSALLSALYLKFAPRSYLAESRILFETRPQTTIVIGTQGSGGVWPASDLSNRMEEIRSQAILERTVRALSVADRRRLVEGLKDVEDTVARAAGVIRRNLGISKIRDSDVLRISFRSHDPELGARVVNTLVDVLRERDLETQRAELSSRRAFIESQLERYRTTLEKAEKELRDFRKANGVLNLDEETSTLLAALSRLDQSIEETETQRKDLEARIAFLQTQLQERGGDTVGTPLLTDQATAKLLDLLGSQEAMLAQLEASGVSPDDPRYRELQQTIEKTRAQLEERLKKPMVYPGGRDWITGVDSLQRALYSYRLERLALDARLRALRSYRRQYEQDLKQLPDQEMRLLQLIRAREVADKIYRMLLEQKEEVQIAEAGRVPRLRIIDRARPNRNPVSPRVRPTLLLGLLLGLFAGLGMALLVESLDTTVKGPKDVEQLTDLPVLGIIPRIEIRYSNGGGEWTLSSPEFPDEARESYQKLYTTLRLIQSARRPLRTLLFTSPGPGEGKSVTAANTALTFAQMGYRVCVVESDLRRPRVHDMFDVPMEPGLTNHLAGMSSLDEVIYSHEEGVDILPSGFLPDVPLRILESSRIRELIQTLTERYDLVIMDSPPILVVSDAVMLSGLVDGVILVVRSGKTHRESLYDARRVLEQQHAPVLGVVLNDLSKREQRYVQPYAYEYSAIHGRNGSVWWRVRRLIRRWTGQHAVHRRGR